MRLMEQSPFMQFQKQLSPSQTSPPPLTPGQQQQPAVHGTAPVQIPSHGNTAEMSHLLLPRPSQASPNTRQTATPSPLPLLQYPALPGHQTSLEFAATLRHQPNSLRLPQLSEDPLTSAASIQHQLLHILQQQQQQQQQQAVEPRLSAPCTRVFSQSHVCTLPQPIDSSIQHAGRVEADTQQQDAASPMSESLGGLFALTDAFASGPPMMMPDSMAAQVAARQAWSEWQRERDSNADRMQASQPLSASLSGLLAAALPGLLEQQSMDLPSSSQLLMPASAGVGSLAGPHTYCSNCTMPIDIPSTDGTAVHTICPACHQHLPQQAAQVDNQPAPLIPDHDSMAVPPPLFPLGLPDMPMTPGGMDSSMLSTTGPDLAMLPEAAPAQQLENVQEPMDESCTLLAYDERMLAHSEPQSGFGLREHPERPARLVSIMQQLKDSGLLARCRQVRGRPATDVELAAVHDPEHIRQVALASASLQERAPYTMSLSGNLHESPTYVPSIDETSRWIMDCPLNAHSNFAACIAAGTAIDVTLAVLSGKARNGAAIIRPPGHHAESALSMGFCIFNNAAVAARAAQKAGAKRVCIMDWDVHHGNGTQHIFYDDPSVLYVSTHRFDDGFFYPGTGSPRDAGVGDGEGYTVNVGWDGPGVTDGDMLAAFRHVVLPIVEEFEPDLVIVSAGFDAAAGDPLGECLLTPALYGKLTEMMMSLGPCVLLLEGGYNLSATAACTAECVRVLLDGASHELPPSSPTQPSADAMSALLQTLLVQSRHWPVAKVHMQLLLAEQAALEAATQAQDIEGSNVAGLIQPSLSGQLSGLGLMSDTDQLDAELDQGTVREPGLNERFSTDIDIF